MRTFGVISTTLTLALMTMPVIASAQSPATNTPPGVSSASQFDAKTSGSTVRVSQLIGLNIQNSQGQSVGEINDLVIDSITGKVCYAAVTYGGFLGVGDKLFAVPFEAFTVRRNPDDPKDNYDYVMVLDVSTQQLEGAQGFDQDHWPSFADKNMVRDLEKRYRINRNRDGNLNGPEGVNVDVNSRGVDVDVNRN